VSESEIKTLKVQLERSKAARLRAWSVLQGLRDTLQAAGVIIPPSTEKSFAREGEFLERALLLAPFCGYSDCLSYLCVFA
jgi:hypothetical protein